MGKYGKGILGSFRGKVGTVIGSSWKNVQYMRSKPDRKKGASTAAQLEQQAKFKRAGIFLKTMMELLNITFDGSAGNMTGFNRAMQYALKNAITGASPDFGINYSMVLISEGDIPNPVDAAAAAAPGAVTFTWTDNSGDGLAAPTDKAILVAYCEAQNKSVFTLNGADRKAGTATLNVPKFKGQTVQVWIGFISANGKEVATSEYLGQLAIS